MPKAEQQLLSFKPFDEEGEVRIYYNGFLPHWRQAGCTYFVTFRLADSIPQGVLRQWEYERAKWLESRGISVSSANWWEQLHQLSRIEKDTFERHFVSLFFAMLDEGQGECVLRQPDCTSIVSKALQHFHGQRLDTGDVVVMPNHVHALLTPYEGFELEDILHSIKSYTSNEIQRLRRTTGALWMKESHDHIVRDGEELLRIQEYIRDNPRKAGLKDGQFHLYTAEYSVE